MLGLCSTWQHACRFGAALIITKVDEPDTEAALLSQEEAMLVASRLHRVLRPVILRRLKEVVAKDLPAKVLTGVAHHAQRCH